MCVMLTCARLHAYQYAAGEGPPDPSACGAASCSRSRTALGHWHAPPHQARATWGQSPPVVRRPNATPFPWPWDELAKRRVGEWATMVLTRDSGTQAQRWAGFRKASAVFACYSGLALSRASFNQSGRRIQFRILVLKYMYETRLACGINVDATRFVSFRTRISTVT